MLSRKIVLLSCLISLFTASYSAESEAKYTKRDGKWEASFQMVVSKESTLDGQNDSSAEVDSDYGWGVTLGHNFNNHLMANFQFSSLTPKYEATVIDEDGKEFDIDHKLSLYQTQFNMVYNFMAQQFTPFVQAGVGWTYMDSNVATGPPETICWYDPWWGYRCNTYQNSYDDSRFSYNLAAGVRYELDNGMFFRASYQQNWTDLSKSGTLSLGMAHFEIGSIF